MKVKITLLGALCLLLGHTVFGQTYTIKGILTDAKDNEPLVGATVVIYPINDSNSKQGSITDIDGAYSLPPVAPGNYQLHATYIGYQGVYRNITVVNADIDEGIIKLTGGATSLKGVVVEAAQIRAQQQGDTTAFNASSFKTNPDATAEDLINKMPGISTAGGGIKVNGEDVKQVLVDGKTFFGDDPNAAIKNLPSEIIDKIQVFDKASDQAAFTGFDDGNSSKTINIVTKKGRNNGVFGKITAGYGEDLESQDGRYTVGGNLNFFNGDRRISLVGLANNVNQQNFSSEDLLGVSSASAGGGRGGGRRGGGGGQGGPGGGGGGGDAASNFLVSQQAGITQTQSAGINYSDQWGKKVKVQGSYFFNRAENNNETDLTRSYILGDADSSLVYKETSLTHSTNVNHRAALRVEWTVDSNNSFILNPKLSFQNNTTESNLLGANSLNGTPEGSPIATNYYAKNTGYNFSNSLLYRHRFAKPGRTISANFDTRYNDKTGNGSLYSLGDTLVDQVNDVNSSGLTLAGNINYTEPVSKRAQIQINYNPSYSHNVSDKNTYDSSIVTHTYTDLNQTLTNRFNNDYTFHRGGIGYRYSDTVINFNATLNGQYATLTGEQDYPTHFNVDRNFTNILPQLMFNYKFSRRENIRIFYRTSTNAPSISQLQNIVDNSNPLFLKTGNADLVQDYNHNLSIRYGKTGASKGNGLFLFANGSYDHNYIGNSTIIARDTMTVGDIRLNPGTQLSRPVNFDASWKANAFITYSMAVKPIKSNVNLSAGFTYNSTPAIINNLTNTANNYAVNGGVVIGSNISENIDFTLSYNGSYTIAKNTLQSQSDFNYYTQTTSLRFNWIFLKGFVFNTNLNHTLYSGLGADYDRQFLLWNASLGYKFGKKKEMQADIYAFDILGQNNSITRSITDSYIEDSRTQVLQRYLMLRLTYTIRAFKAGAKMPTQEDRPDGGWRHREGRGGQNGGGDFGGPPPGGG